MNRLAVSAVPTHVTGAHARWPPGDVDAVITSMSRGFPGDDLVSLLRYQPSVPLLFVLKRVLEGFRPETVEARR